MTNRTQKTPNKTKQRGQAVKPRSGRIPVNTAFDREIYNRLLKAKSGLGLSYEQDVIRLAVASFLNKNGF